MSMSVQPTIPAAAPPVRPLAAALLDTRWEHEVFPLLPPP